MGVLKVKVDGVWTDVPMTGGVDEVYVGPDAPPTTFDLWVDSDDVGQPTGLLWSRSWVQAADPSYMNNFEDHVWTDTAGAFPFPTVAVVDISSIYIKPDRQFNLSAQLFTNSYGAPSPPAGLGRVFGITPTVASNGAQYTMVGSLRGAYPLVANVTGPAWTIRLSGVTGGLTAYGYSYVVLMQRFAVVN